MEVVFVKRQTWLWFGLLSAPNQSYQKTGVSHDTSRLAKNKKTTEKSGDNGIQTKSNIKNIRGQGGGRRAWCMKRGWRSQKYTARGGEEVREGGKERECGRTQTWSQVQCSPLCLWAVVSNEQVPQRASRIQTRSDRKTSPSQQPPLPSPLAPLLRALSPSLSCLQLGPVHSALSGASLPPRWRCQCVWETAALQLIWKQSQNKARAQGR